MCWRWADCVVVVYREWGLLGTGVGLGLGSSWLIGSSDLGTRDLAGTTAWMVQALGSYCLM